jgi:hypothetical protein
MNAYEIETQGPSLPNDKHLVIADTMGEAEKIWFGTYETIPHRITLISNYVLVKGIKE